MYIVKYIEFLKKKDPESDRLYAINLNAIDKCYTFDSSLGTYACQTLHQWDNSIKIVEGEF